MKPYSEACDENRLPILQVISEYYRDARDILEIGSGTGQHAVFFAEQLPYLHWHCSDLAGHHPGILQWLTEYQGKNISGPYSLDVNQPAWPDENFDGPEIFDGIFSANTAHIMSWPEVEKMFVLVSGLLKTDGHFCLYGPFNYNGAYTSASNEQFDSYLKERDPKSGIRDLRDLNPLAKANGLILVFDHEMPVNNRTLVWKKV
jgi:cyclopropane fatty-acyl-phospholipid synthase-like methyltransferase